MIEIQAENRTYKKKQAIKHLRKKNKCPAVIYGKNNSNLIIQLNQNDIQNPKIINQLYKNNIIKLLLNKINKTVIVKIQQIQYHPLKSIIIHIDFIYC